MFFFHENLHRDITLETFAKNLHHFMSPRGNIAMMKISLEKFRKKKIIIKTIMNVKFSRYLAFCIVHYTFLCCQFQNVLNLDEQNMKKNNLKIMVSCRI